MLIGFIWDIVLLVKGDIANVIYVIIYFIICFLYCILTIIDYFFIDTLVKLVVYRTIVINGGEEKSKKKEKEEFDNETNKTKNE